MAHQTDTDSQSGVAAVADLPSAAPERAAILNQLENLVTSPYFSGSKRCVAMLRHVVEQAINGKSHELKERTLGIEVFHRPADYDTNIDPVVRLAAGDIRKRLAQYYCEPPHESALRIALPSGSYVPEFHWPEPARTQHQPPSATETPGPAASRRRPLVWLVAGLAFVLLVGTGFGVRAFLFRSALDLFWAPLRGAHSPVLICVGQPPSNGANQPVPGATDQSTVGTHLLRADAVNAYDAMAAGRLSGVLGKLGIAYTLQASESTSLSDLRNGPAILVSGADNPWTLRATHDLRYSFTGAPSGSSFRIWIVDRNMPSRRDWAVDFNAPYNSLSQDYALVGRFLNPTTGQIAVVAAGIGANGTQSAAECLSENGCLEQIVHLDPAHGKKSNFEAVLRTQVIDGRSGPPTVLAVESW